MPKQKRVRYIDRDELKNLWRILERLQVDVQPDTGSYVWRQAEREALTTVMDAVLDTYGMIGGPSLEEQWEQEEQMKQIEQTAAAQMLKASNGHQ